MLDVIAPKKQVRLTVPQVPAIQNLTVVLTFFDIELDTTLALFRLPRGKLDGLQATNYNLQAKRRQPCMNFGSYWATQASFVRLLHPGEPFLLNFLLLKQNLPNILSIREVAGPFYCWWCNLGVHWQGQWCTAPWLEALIQYKAFTFLCNSPPPPILVAFVLWAQYFVITVIFWSDNEAVVHINSLQISKSKSLIMWLVCCFAFHYTIISTLSLSVFLNSLMQWSIPVSEPWSWSTACLDPGASGTLGSWRLDVDRAALSASVHQGSFLQEFAGI